MKKLVSSVLAASMVLSLAACGSSASSAAESTAASSEASSTAATAEAGEGSGTYTGTPIKIGGIGPITGGAAVYGQAVKNAEELAVKEINAANGSDVFEWKFEDDEHDAEKSVNAYNTLKDWGLQVLAGPVTTTPSLAVAAETANDNIFMMTPSASAVDVIAAGDNVFQICFTDPNQGVASADYIADNQLGPRSASSMILPTLTAAAFMISSRLRLLRRAWRSSPMRPSLPTTSLTCPPRLPSARRLALIWSSCPSTIRRLLRS